VLFRSVWSRKSIGVPSFSSILKFRISGQGKTFFGDGLALWIVKQSYYTEGDVHGYNEKFVGIGIIFDTFRNTESYDKHRDVTVLINDGEKTLEMMTKDVIGCNINVRYHAERADFTVNDLSRARIIFNNTNFQLHIDAKNSGQWEECITLSNLTLPADFTENAYIGLTASTGQLADNHDVLGLATYSDFNVMESFEAEKSEKRLYPQIPDEPMLMRVRRLEDHANEVLGKLDFVDHHVEHELVSVNDHIESMLAKLKKREDVAEGRIDNLEDTVRKEVEGTLSKRIAAVEARLEKSLDISLSNKVSQEASNILSSTKLLDKDGVPSCQCSSWLLYFTILINIGVCGFAYDIYRRSRKFHLP